MRVITQLVLISLLLARTVMAGELPGPLVNADWLMEHRDNIIVLDLRKNMDSFLKDGHIEGAIAVDVRDIRTDREEHGKQLKGMLPSARQFQAVMSRLGVSNDSQVVITHPGEQPGEVAGAARLYWSLRMYGFEHVALLDGGNRAWTEALGDLVTEASPVHNGKFIAGNTGNAFLATMADVEQALQDSETQLVDSRSLRFHIGLEQRDYVYAPGHITGSRLFPYTFLHPEKGSTRFLPRDTIRASLHALGIDTGKSLILYCNSAYECADLWFALHELLAVEKVRIYDGALNEWTQYPAHPMTTVLTGSEQDAATRHE